MDTEKIRQQLLKEREQLLAKARKLLEDGKTSVEEAMDLVDKAAMSYEKEYIFTLSYQEKETLEKIKRALARIEQGNYGVCLQCKKPIPVKRLKAVPWAEYCLSCKEQIEQGREV